MKMVIVQLGLFIGLSSIMLGQRTVTFSLADRSAQVQGDLYGEGSRGLVLAHGGRFNEKSWKKQAEVFAKSGFLVLAVRFRGDKLNPDGSPSAGGEYWPHCAFGIRRRRFAGEAQGPEAFHCGA